MEKIVNTAIPPGDVGFVDDNMYPYKNGQGDAAKCKSMLASAGYQNGVTLPYPYANDSVNSATFPAIQASLQPCGVNLVGKPEPGSTSSSTWATPRSTTRLAPGTWASRAGSLTGGGPNGRTIIDPLFKTRCVVNTNNYGCLSDPALDKPSSRRGRTAVAVGALWARRTTSSCRTPRSCRWRAQNFLATRAAGCRTPGSTAIVFTPNIGTPDITNVWLNPTALAS